MRRVRVRFSVHPLAAAGLFLLLFVFPGATSFAALCSVLIHEAGHATAALLYRRRICGVTLMPVGVSLRLTAPAGYTEELLIAAAGPLLSFLFAASSVFFRGAAVAEEIAFFSLTLGLLNLLPIRTFDGGRMLAVLLSRLGGTALAARVLSFTTAASLFCLWTLALYVLFYSGANLTLLVFCAYLFAYLVVKKEENLAHSPDS